MALKTLMARLQESQKKLSEEAREQVAKTIGEILPDGSRLEWYQYTPYFNDGEPCTFSVHKPTLFINGHSIDIGWISPGRTEIVSDELYNDIQDAWKNIPSALFESAFGEHAIVTVRSGGEVEIEEYTDHD